MLTAIVSRLDGLDELSKEVAALANRHVSYGVKPFHYKLVGEALLWTLQQGLGKHWNPELEEAWKACYQELSTSMIRSTGYKEA